MLKEIPWLLESGPCGSPPTSPAGRSLSLLLLFPFWANTYSQAPLALSQEMSAPLPSASGSLLPPGLCIHRSHLPDCPCSSF